MKSEEFILAHPEVLLEFFTFHSFTFHLLELTRKVELDILKVLLSHRENVARVGKENVTTVLVLCHILILTFLECLKFLSIVALNPASLMQMNRFPTTLGVVLVLKSVLDNLKLKLAYSTHDSATIKLIYEQLGNILLFLERAT